MRNDTMDNFDSQIVSLLLHEFGHQLGLDHNSTQGCLMNAQTEFSDRGKLLEEIDDFCDHEKNQIKNMIL
jgi:predicted Zn-dependent protease